MNQLLRIHAIWNPHVYHGWGRSKRFFEGWYYKIVNESQTSAFAIIPGIAMDENGNKQSFIYIYYLDPLVHMGYLIMGLLNIAFNKIS